MKTEHIKGVAVVTNESELWKHMEFPEGDHWHVIFEVSEDFERAFMRHMTRVADVVFDNGLDQDFIVFHYDGSSWFISDTGKHIVRSTAYDDIMEKEIPEDWWMDNIALMKAVLAKV